MEQQIDLRDRWPLPPYFSTNPSPDTRAMTRGELETLQQEYTGEAGQSHRFQS